MGRTAHLAAALLLAAFFGACTKPTPTTAPPYPTPSQGPGVTSAPSPTTVAAAPTPPYTIRSGRPVGATSVDVELFRQDGESWTPKWLNGADIAPEATGILGSLPMFKEPGIYRLDIRARGRVIATSLLSMAPPCVGVCTGG